MTAAASRNAAPAMTPWAARFGDWAFAVSLPAHFGNVRRPWHGSDALPIQLNFQAHVGDEAVTAADTKFTRLDAAGFAFRAAACHGDGDWTTGTGALWLHDGAAAPVTRAQMLQEALFAACFARLLTHGGVLLHAATLWIDGAAYVVAGPSTAGKSTLAARFGPNWWSDEHAFLLREADTWHVLRHAEFRANQGDFPWRAPLAGLLWLGPERHVSRLRALSPGETFQRVLPQALLAGPVTTAPVLDAVTRLCHDFAVQELSHHLATPLDALAAVIAGAHRAAA